MAALGDNARPRSNVAFVMTEELEPPSKSERKRQSSELQDLGEALIELSQAELDALPLPDVLRDAVMLARRITAHGGLYRQKQYIGKLMRKIDAEPIRAALAARRERERVAAVRFRRIESWRDRLLREGSQALDQLKIELGDNTDMTSLTSLVDKARSEQQLKSPPHASRELFRALKELFERAQSTGEST
ncbi:MAG TPA: ribosome biogenesis factor YjgA [Steroidobacteraceae bacterium]|nr:ribosome biogenesis factor YjgA [Steroidobacteraceae bacterium]